MNIKDIFNNSRMATPKRFQDYVVGLFSFIDNETKAKSILF